MSYEQPEWKAFLHTPGTKKEESAVKQRAIEVMEWAGLLPHKDKLAVNLSSGYQRDG
jgi:ABC-type branched-subunit amino acid transport system ATPase component